MHVEMYELRCSRTSQVKMFVTMSAEKARRLNRLLTGSGSSFHFVPCVAAKRGVGDRSGSPRLEHFSATVVA